MPSLHSPIKNHKVPAVMQPLIFGAVAGLVCAVVIVGALIFAFSKLKIPVNMESIKDVDTPVQSTDEPLATETPVPSPTNTPKPTAKPTAKPNPQSNSGTGTSANCDTMRSGGPSNVIVKLVPDSGQMVGSTVVRIKPGGNCPGATGNQEQWLSEGEREKTFGNMTPGTYFIEIANGNYQGVIRQVITVEANRTHVFTVQVRG